jgi:uncharacterized protein (DUF2267 family)
MTKDELINQVMERTNLSSKAMTERAIQIVFSALSHRLAPEENRDVEAQLPRDWQDLWHRDIWLVNFLHISGPLQLKYRHIAELYSIIQEELRKLQIPVGPETLTMVVFSLLKEQIGEGEARGIAEQLPKEIEQLWLAS